MFIIFHAICIFSYYEMTISTGVTLTLSTSYLFYLNKVLAFCVNLLTMEGERSGMWSGVSGVHININTITVLCN